MRPSCASSRLATETLQEKSARLLLRSSSAWSYFSILQPGRFGSVEKVGVASDPKRVGPASRNLEYG